MTAIPSASRRPRDPGKAGVARGSVARDGIAYGAATREGAVHDAAHDGAARDGAAHDSVHDGDRTTPVAARNHRKSPRKGRAGRTDRRIPVTPSGWRAPRWRRHGAIRPTPAGLVLLAFDALCWYAGLLLDDRTLMAAALVLSLAFACSLIIAAAQWALAAPKGRFARRLAAMGAGGRGSADGSGVSAGGPIIIEAAGGAFGGRPRGADWLMPRTLALSRSQWERLDQDDTVISRHIGSAPSARGLYREASRFVRWHEPFGLCSISRVIPCGKEVLVTPEPADMDGRRRRIADQRLKGSSDTQDAGSVRPYVAGDPPKLISWKATAHHGGLMTRETSRDTHPTMVVACDVRTDGVTGAQADAQAAMAMGLAEASGRSRDGERLVVTDGRAVADTPAGVSRLLAALMPVPPAAGASGRPAGKPAGKGTAGEDVASADVASVGLPGVAGLPGAAAGDPDWADAGDAAEAGVAVPFGAVGSDSLAGVAGDGERDGRETSRLAHGIARQVSSRRDVKGVLLLTARPQGELALELRRLLGDDLLHVVPVTSTATGAVPAGANAGEGLSGAADGHAPSTSASAGPVADSGRDDAAAGDGSVAPGWRSSNDSPASRPTSSSSSSSAQSAWSARPPSSESPSSSQSEPSQPPEKTTADGRGGTGFARPRGRRGAWAGRILTMACLLAFAGLLVGALTVLVDGSGMWARFAAVALAVAVCEANLPFVTRHGPVVRMLAALAADMAATAALVVVRVHDATGAWAFDTASAMGALAQTGRSGAAAAASAPAWQIPWLLTGRVLEDGFDGLLRQLPPVGVDAAGDAVLVIAVGLTVALIRCLLVWRSLTPALAALPVVALAADYALLGHQADWWEITLLAAAFLLSLWAVRPGRAHWPLPVSLVAIVTATSMALTPAAVRFANAVPLSIGDSTGLLSANTINPMVDLKRSLRAGSNATVLTYRSTSGRQYLRMTTLDQFDGDAWSFDDDLADDANLYGSGIQLGQNGDPTGQDAYDWRAAWARRYDNPLLVYSSLLADDGTTSGYATGGGYGTAMAGFDSNYGGSGVGSGSGSGTATGSGRNPIDSYSIGSPGSTTDGTGSGSGASGASSFFHAAEVTIGSLRSRFLPAAGTDPLRYRGAGNDWVQSGQTIYNRGATTSEGLHYTTVGVGLEPIATTAGFSRIDAVDAMRATLEQLTQETTWAQRTSLRAAAVTSGLATERDGWMLLRATLGTDGIVRDTAGNAVGESATSYQDSGRTFGSNEGAATIQRGMRLSDAFRQRFGVDGDETIGILVAQDGSLDIAVRMEESASDAPPDITQLTQLRVAAGYTGLMLDNGAGQVDAAIATRTLQHLDDVAVQTKANYRSLPESLPANVTALVDRARAEGIATDGDTHDQQVAALRWLVGYFTNPDNGFTYSLDAPDGDGRSNMEVIDDFLDAKAGYCTHYASALAVLGRAMGVPTRMVLGYNKGVAPADENGDYQVAAKQLHAWADAWIDGVGWVPFDVTPATPANGSASDGTDQTTSSDGSTTQDQSTDSESADVQADAQDRSADTQDATDGQPADSQDATAQAGDAGRLGAALPQWAVATLWGLLGLGLAVALAITPRMVRAARRRRRLRAVAVASGPGTGPRPGGGDGAFGRACAQALAELYDTAWDVGVRWDRADGDAAVCGRIAGMVPDAAADVRCVVDAAVMAAFAGDDAAGAVGAMAGDGTGAGDAGGSTAATALCAHLDTACRALRDAGRAAPLHVRVARFLLPASLRRPR